MNKVNVLLTGHTGFLGRAIRSFLETNNYTVLQLSKEDGGRIDITKPITIDPTWNIEFVVHAAGKAHSVPTSPQEEKEFFNVNYEGTKNLCEALNNLEVKVKSFVFISTVSVYGVECGNNIDEEHPLMGTSPYARSKIMAEEHLKSWAQTFNIPLSILRLPLIAGNHPPGNLGSMINAISTGKYLSIGDGSARKSMVWDQDVASLIPVVAAHEGIFNLTDRHHPSFREVELAISERIGKKAPLRIPLAVGKLVGLIGDLVGVKSPINSDKVKKITSDLTFNDDKAVTILGWKPSIVIGKIGDVL